MAVPFIDLKRLEPGFLDRWAEKCAELTRTTQFVGGAEVARLEERLRERTGAAVAVGCANGTDALQLALRAAGAGAGDEVLLPDATFWATFEAVVNVGARPVTVDIDPADLQMDYDLFVRAAEERRPKAAILVHLYGWGSARLADFRTFCRERSIALIEDGAQAFGVSYRGESIFKDAELATLSFYPAKVLGSCGDAGAVFAATEELGDRVRTLGNHGRTTHYGHGYVGWNSRMAGFDAGFLNISLDYIDSRMESRRAVTQRYREAFKELAVPYMAPPADYIENGYLSVMLPGPEVRPVIEQALKQSGIGFGTVYPGAMSQQPGAEGFLAGRYGGENADRLCRGVLNLPVFAGMTDAEVEEVIGAFAEAWQSVQAAK